MEVQSRPQTSHGYPHRASNRSKSGTIDALKQQKPHKIYHYLDPRSTDKHAFLYKQINNDIVRNMQEVETRTPLSMIPNRRVLSEPEVKRAQRPTLAHTRTPTSIRIRKPHPSERVQQPQRAEQPRPAPQRQRSLPRKTDWALLPPNVLGRVLGHLKALHLNRLGNGCDTCYARDLSSLQRVCGAWRLIAQKRLYERIVLVGNDDKLKLKKHRIPRGARIYLLRRTLRNKAALADLVRDIHVEDPLVPAYLEDDTPNIAFNEFRDLVASLVICCPNLERLTGFYSSYNHEFDLLTHALSQRSYLKEHVWVIGENEEVTARSLRQLPPGILTQSQSDQFWGCHRQWTLLESLLLCSPGSVGVVEHELFVRVFRSLPSLKRLCISSFDADDFTDETLLAAPVLEDLRIEECSGVTEGGLTRWAAGLAGSKVRRLALIHQNITALLTISKLFTFLNHLQKFTIIQTDVPPSLPLELLVFQPVMASNSLRGLHWDVTCGNSPDQEMYRLDIQTPSQKTASQVQTPHTPNAHLALSILHGGFPSLERLRAPRDTSPRGALQSVCQPIHNSELSLDSYFYDQSFRPLNNLRSARIRARDIAHSKLQTQDGYATVKASRTDLKHEDIASTNFKEQDMARKNLKREDTDTSFNSISSLTTTSTDATDPELFASQQNLVKDRRWDLNGFARDVATSQSTTTLDRNGASITYSGPSNNRITTATHETPAGVISLSRTDSLCHCPPQLSKSNSVCSCCDPQPPTLRIPPRNSSIPKHPTGSPIIPTRSPLRPQPIIPLRIHEFSLPSFMGRVATTESQAQIYVAPIFDLNPDIPGRDTNGGVVGWGDLLRISDKARVASSGTKGKRIRNGCVGGWNQECAGEQGRRGSQWWRHVERERRWESEDVEVGLFF